MHRRFEVIPGAQAQVDWGDEDKILAHMSIPKVYSFHMTLSYSRDPFCCFTTSQDLQTFFDCHRRAFAPWGGRRQRGHGVLLQPAAEERPRPSGMGHPRGTADRDRDLDREDLSPAPQTSLARPATKRSSFCRA